jgi:hypothetical protein
VSTPQARRDLFVGAAWLLAAVIGWVVNMGHRLDVVQRVYHDQPPYFRGFAPVGGTFVRGLKAAGAIAVYLSPAMILGTVGGLQYEHTAVFVPLVSLAGVAFAVGIFVLPGGMTYNAAFNDLSYLYRPDKAMRRALEGGRLYLRAWTIAAAAITLSLLGLLAAGVGFLVTSVWAWQVVGYAFSRALVLRERDLPPAA